MADSDKNIVITPNIGSTNDPTIVFTGGDNNPITLTILDDGTLSFDGSSGQLFSITDSLTGTIFSVNDVSGIPSIEVDDDGTIRFAEYSGNILIGTATDDGTNKVQINGSVSVNDDIDITSTGELKIDGTAVINSSGEWVGDPTNLQGPQGLQGLQGLQGKQGLQGRQGTVGSTGSTGSQGTQGTQGLQGRQGLQGLQGKQGTTGSTGSTGSQGTQGTQGTQGLQGLQGKQGLQGRQGTTGSTGSTGSQGTQGTQGLQGLQGKQGLQGRQGTTGSTGSQGTQGTQGLQGLQGIQGRQGLQGRQGTVGSTGPSTAINATNDTSTTTLYPVMVGAAGSNQTPKVTTTATALKYNASTRQLQVGSLETNSAPNVGSSNSSSADFSSAFGYNNTASANYSSSFGYFNEASAKRSAAFGYFNEASAERSAAFGYYNNASGGRSSAIGVYNRATALNSVSFGLRNRTLSTAYTSVSVGILNNTSGATITSFNGVISGTIVDNSSQARISSAVGIKNLANGVRSSAFGYGNTASAYLSSSIGYQNTASAYYSSAFGYSNEASAFASSAFGYTNEASGSGTSAFGYSNTASGYYSSTFGRGNNVSGSYASAIGHRVKVTVSDVQELGYWSSTTVRGGAVRVHGNDGYVAISLENQAAAYTDGGTTAGSEADGTLMREAYALRRDGTDLYVDFNAGGSITTKGIGGTVEPNFSSGNDNYIPRFLNAEGTLIGTSEIYQTSSRIGIGLTNPSSGTKLHVDGVIKGSSIYSNNYYPSSGVTTYYLKPADVGVSLNVAGDIRAAGDITAYYSSDKRLKENIKVIPHALSKINKLSGYEYDWKDEHLEKSGGEDNYFNRKHDVGVIAQELQAVLPEAVAERQDGNLGVRYEKIIPLLIEAIKEQQKQIEELKSRWQ